MKSNVVIDIDGVLADFEGYFCDTFKYWKNRHIIDLEKRFRSLDNLYRIKIQAFVGDPFTYANLKTIPLGVEIARFLYKEGVEVCLVSSRPAYALQVTRDWLFRHGVNYNYLTVGNKDKTREIQKLDPILIIDDIPAVLENIQGLGIFSAIFDQEWNKNCTFPRIKTMADFEIIWETVLEERRIIEKNRFQIKFPIYIKG